MRMNRAIVFLMLAGLLVIALVRVSGRRAANSQSEQREIENLFLIKEETRVDAGFSPIWTIRLLMPSEHFSEDNLTRVFRLFSSRHPNNEEKLHISVYTSVENLAKEQEDSYLDFVMRGGDIPFDPKERRNFCDAMFFRTGNGDFALGGENEWYWYSPDLNNPNEKKTVVLKGAVGVRPSETR